MATAKNSSTSCSASTGAHADPNTTSRSLVFDQDEALEQAELLLKERSLTAYYDEVALKACNSPPTMRNAACWAFEKLERIKRSVRSLVKRSRCARR